jgi:hypothetical protein
MLDYHPQLAIPPETGFLIAPEIAEGRDPGRVAGRMTRFPVEAPVWPDFGIPADEFIAAADRLPVAGGARAALRLFYRLYAVRHGKPRGGDKTPLYVRHMPRVAATLPEARFIHLLRDGRDVALSWRKMWFAPSKDLRELVRLWASTVLNAHGEVPDGKYLEVRYEELVRAPQTVLKTICTFIELEFSPLMLSYHTQSAERLEEHGARLRPDGSPVVSQEQRRDQQRLTMSPPQPSRIGTWRTLMSQKEASECAAEFGSLLGEF